MPSTGDVVWVTKPGDPKGDPRPAIVVRVDALHGMALVLPPTKTDRQDIAAIRIEARTRWAMQMGLRVSTHFYVTNFAALQITSLPTRSGTAPPAVMIDAGQLAANAIVQFVRQYPPPRPAAPSPKADEE